MRWSHVKCQKLGAVWIDQVRKIPTWYRLFSDQWVSCWLCNVTPFKYFTDCASHFSQYPTSLYCLHHHHHQDNHHHYHCHQHLCTPLKIWKIYDDVIYEKLVDCSFLQLSPFKIFHTRRILSIHPVCLSAFKWRYSWWWWLEVRCTFQIQRKYGDDDVDEDDI